MTLAPLTRPQGDLPGGSPPGTPAVPPADCGLFRAVMRHHAKGVSVITAGTGTPAGFCATSLASVSLAPPLLSFTVGLRASSLPVVEAARHVAVHLLAEDQQELASRFGLADAEKFGPETSWRRGPFGLPLLDGVLAWLVLAPVSLLPAGDHRLVIGQVVTAGQERDAGPLVHYDGGFGRLAGS